MINSKLIQLLKSLTPTEFRQFNKYIQASFINKSALILKLYKYLRKYYPDFDASKLAREKVYAHLFPKTTFNSAKLRDLNFKLTKIVENYLIHLELEQEDYQKKKLLAQIYKKRNLKSLFRKKTEGLLKEIDTQPIRDATYHFEKYQLQRTLYFHIDNYREGSVAKIIEHAYDELNYFFAIERLKIGIELRTRSKFYAEVFNVFNPTRFTFSPPPNSEVYDLLKEVAELIDHQRPSNYFTIKSKFQSVFRQLQREDQQVILISLLNFSLSRIAKEGTLYTQEAFELNEFGLQHNLFITHNTTFPGIIFLNIVQVSASLQYFDWAKDFINKYGKYLIGSDAAYIKPYALACLTFYQGDFKETVAILNAHKFSESLIEMNARFLILRAYYELTQLDQQYQSLLDAYLKSCDKYVSREKRLEANRITTIENFLLIFKTFLRYKKTANPKWLQRANELLETLSPISAKPWLLQKIQASNQELGLK